MMKKSEIKPGAILCANWGYNCSRWSFYKVEKTTEKSVWLRRIGKKYTSGEVNSPCATVVPDDRSEVHATFTRRILKGYDGEDSACIKISEYEYCYNIHKNGHQYDECCD